MSDPFVDLGQHVVWTWETEQCQSYLFKVHFQVGEKFSVECNLTQQRSERILSEARTWKTERCADQVSLSTRTRWRKARCKFACMWRQQHSILGCSEKHCANIVSSDSIQQTSAATGIVAAFCATAAQSSASSVSAPICVQ